MEERTIKFATVVCMAVMVGMCVLFPKLSAIRTWEAEHYEMQIAEDEFAQQQMQMSEFEIKATMAADSSKRHQLRLKLPQENMGDLVAVSNDHVTQTITITIPHTDFNYFENEPLMGSSDHIDNLSYLFDGKEGIIEITMDQVYELELNYDNQYYYLDFLTPHDVYDKVVVIDAGHGGKAPGATKQGISEKDIDLAIVLELKELLEHSGENIGVYYTRTDDSNPTFSQRVQLANKSQANLFISIHNNSTNRERMSSINGTQVMYSESDEREKGSMEFAQICLEQMTLALGSKDKGLVEGDEIYIIRMSEVPVALIEVGFMTNQQELDLLKTKEYQKKAAEGVYAAILKAFENGY